MVPNELNWIINKCRQQLKIIAKCTCILGKAYPTTKLATQLMRTDILMAAGRGPCENNSATISHGIDPVNIMKLKQLM